MKVKDILALAASDLGREDLVALVYDCAEAPAGELASLLRCYQLVENEIALDYFPLLREETLRAEGDTVPYSAFSLAPVEIRRVTDVRGVPVSYEVCAEGILLRAPHPSAVKTLFSYSPAEKGWNDESEYSGKISARLLSFGVACEFCLSSGQYAEAAAWEKKYREALRAANVIRKKLAIRSRRWA